ncbi:hypothetical protein RFI_02176 [Reticulomyxa filosa]|uniref:Uncharacterized protein n=1 Tax=Reticulomyxa filosa TaxID=46433 RepID=X6P8S0_RETFI|nr:hypothetical protein RFI_02176 [Reticulomyxa filosa]|eukprot:ETO34910.1 hypothetical protein RFI_02176 [Reticulomyxa filosa]
MINSLPSFCKLICNFLNIAKVYVICLLFIWRAKEKTKQMSLLCKTRPLTVKRKVKLNNVIRSYFLIDVLSLFAERINKKQVLFMFEKMTALANKNNKASLRNSHIYQNLFAIFPFQQNDKSKSYPLKKNNSIVIISLKRITTNDANRCR